MNNYKHPRVPNDIGKIFGIVLLVIILLGLIGQAMGC